MSQQIGTNLDDATRRLDSFLADHKQTTVVSEAELSDFDRDGYVVLRRTLEFWSKLGIDIDAAARRVDELLKKEGEFAGREGKDYLVRANKVVEPGANRLANLVDKDPLFLKLAIVPDFLACARHVLGNGFRLSSFTMREPQAGAGGQGLHLDWQQRESLTSPFASICAYVCLDNMTPDNGPLSVLRGSHTSCIDIKTGSRLHPNPKILELEPAAIRVQARKGDVIMLNVQTFHGGTVNTSGARRRVLFINYRNRELRQQQSQNRLLSPDTKKRLTEFEKFILGVGRQSFRDWSRDLAFRNKDRRILQVMLGWRANILKALGLR